MKNEFPAPKMDWRKEPEMPRAGEIMASKPPALPHDEVETLSGNKNLYLEVQYRLLRYEGTELLRRSVQEFRENPRMAETENTAIYTDVSALSRLPTDFKTGYPTFPSAKLADLGP